MTFDHQSLNDFRHRVIKGEQVSEDELKNAIRYLANLRSGVADSTTVPKAPKKSLAQAKAEAADLLKDFL